MELGARDLTSMAVFLAVFVGTIALGALVLYYYYGDHRRTLARLRGLALDRPGSDTASVSEIALQTLPRVGTLVLPTNREQLNQLKTRLTQAGIYGPNSLSVFLGAQLLLTLVLPLAAGLFPYLLGLLSWKSAVVLGLIGGAVGLLTPSFWVDYQKSRRQNELRCALPDALDMLVLCLEAGISLLAALQRVTSELEVVHPALGRELNIVQREVQLGLSAGDALEKLGVRSGMEEFRTLASVIQQAERYGASSAKALRLHADFCRQDRQQRAEEKAQKASVKILFPTLLCIFPAIFIVILGPAAYQIYAMLSRMR
jgi:tight adherence protein C